MSRPSGVANVAMIYDESADSLEIGYTLNSASDSTVIMDAANTLPVNIHGNVTVSSNLEVGTANLFVDTTTGNVGVGTDAPAYKLDVHGSANVDTMTINSNVYAPNLPLATIASNLVTWNSSTGDLMDSGGLITNKLAIVSEQPPVALTGMSTVVDGHGTYKVTASVGATDGDFATWRMFDKVVGTGWSTGAGGYYDFSGTHTGDGTLGGVNGEWLKLELPYKTILRHISLVPRNTSSYTCMPEVFTILGSNDNSSWTTLKAFTGQTWNSLDEIKYLIDASTYYKYYAIVVEETNTNFAAIGEWRLFTESFAIDGGKVAMASAAITGGNTVVDQTGPHARASPPLRKYPEIVFTQGEFEGNDSTNTYTQAGYTVSASSMASSSFPVWNVHSGIKGGLDFFYSSIESSTEGFIGASNTYVGNSSLGGISGEWVKTKFPVPIKMTHVDVTVRDSSYVAFDWQSPSTFYIIGSNDDTTWSSALGTVVDRQYTASDLTERVILSNTNYYKYYAIVVTKVSGNRVVTSIDEIEYYGYEETSDPDTSVDTTITSQFNLPDTTGVKLYIDGDKGSTPTDYSGEGHTLTDNSESFSGNAWSFSSLATSNVTMSTGDLVMEGTHPHSVSLWFNAANVSSNATLFHVGTAAGEGDAKTAISLTETGHLGWIDGGDNQFVTSNTWHNLVYATQGGGGLRTCYLDGRKLGDTQVQDTFGDYPPFAMSTYSDRGYTVSSSGYNDSSGDRRVWLMFNNSTTDFYTFGPHYNSSTGDYTRSPASKLATTDIDGNSIPDGEFLKLEVPHKLLLQYITMIARTGQTVAAPRLWRMYGSNDDTNWKLLRNKTASTVPADTAGTNYTINASKGYKYFALVVTQNGGYAYCNIAELKYYGHKENDTTRFPVSSTVLKYPHIAMTGPAQRGYVVTSASTSDTGGTAIEYDGSNDAYKVFNGVTGSYYFGLYDSGTNSPYITTTGYWDTANYPDLKLSSSSGTPAGDWVSIEMPRKLTLQRIEIAPRGGSLLDWSIGESARDFEIWATNDNSSWTRIHQTVDATAPTTLGEIRSFDVNASVAYKRFALIVTRNGSTYTGGTGRPAITLDVFNLYGTEEDLDIVARVGEGLDGKVANFRVYDKYLHEEQALELWDAQKDQFGVATSSVVVHKGRLGVGTTEPEGRFAVLDEPGDVEEFPPRAMTAAETYMDGHGVFRASASYTEPDSSFGPPAPWKAFSKDTESQTTGWSGSNDHNAVTGSNPGEYNGTNQLASSTPLGEWLKIELPHKIKLNSYALKPLGIANRYGVADYPKTFYIYGSNDGSSWELIDSRVNTTKTPQILGAAVASNETITYSISNNGLAYYDKYAIVITKINSEAVYAVDNTIAATYVAIGEWRLFGTRQGQSTLHDGELKLTKNLTVPRIGPPLDADDTPRRDKLVVEYNTSTNPVENGMVRDTSGRGLDGLIRGSASYDATEKAFNIVASSDILTTGTNIGGVSGDFLASVSLWFKPSTVTSATSQILFIHTSAYAAAASFLVNIYEDQIAVGHGSTNNSYKDGSLVANEWYHVVAIKKGTGAVSNNIYEIYLNGTKLALTNGAGTDVMNVSSDQAIIIGGAREVAVNTEQFVGKISNVKYYPGIVLTTEEAKRLYDMGRLGNVIAQPVHIAAPLQVEKTLRVPIDGTTLGTTGMIRFNTSSGRLQVHDGTTWSTIGNTIATGGTVTNSGGYTIHTFTSSGNFTVYVGGDVEYLVVAGGGGGGYDGGGGGWSRWFVDWHCHQPYTWYVYYHGR
jgi:hypothetical protein